MMMKTGGCMCLALAFAGCSDPTEPDVIACTGQFVSGIVVEIIDENNGLFIAEGARGAVRDGAYLDSLTAFEFTSTGVMRSRQAAGERTGTFQVSVSHGGYEDWILENVKVEEDGCHVIPRRLRAAMIPLN